MNIDWIAAYCTDDALFLWALKDNAILEQSCRQSRPPAADFVAFEAGLLAQIQMWLPASGAKTLVLAAGAFDPMAARRAPCTPLDTKGPVCLATQDSRLDLRFVTGIEQAIPLDLLGGEETCIAGFLALRPNFDGIILLAQNRAVWVLISAGEIVGFQSFLTGELYNVLRQPFGSSKIQDKNPLLKHEPFLGALSDAISRPERLAAHLSTLRVQVQLSVHDDAHVQSAVLGHLMGAELASARPYWLGQSVVVLGSGLIASAYQEALRAQGTITDIFPAQDCALAGLAKVKELTRNI
jgi:2-dehydro-3-deoxygalactonokinase